MEKICKYCDESFILDEKPKGWIANHTRWCKKNPKRNQYTTDSLKYARSKIDIEKRNKSIKKAHDDGKYKNAKYRSRLTGIKLSEEHKIKISEKLKIAHQENRHPGWLNANRNSKSYPEKLFEQFAVHLIEKYDIISQFPFHGYFFDYALIDCKIDIEIDGSQHYRTNENIEYDINRDKFVLAKEWKVYRISAKELMNNSKEEIIKLENFIEENLKYRVYNREDLKEYFEKNKRKYGSREEYSKSVMQINDKKNLLIVKQIEESNINFSKLGWVTEVSKIIGISSQKTSKWMKRFAPHIYAICYRRCFNNKKCD